MADAGAGLQPGGISHFISGLSEVTVGGLAMPVEDVGAAPRDVVTHFKKFSFSAPTSAAFPRILKKAVPLSSAAIAPMIRPSLVASPFSGWPDKSTTATWPRAVDKGWIKLLSFSSVTGGWASWPNQRLTLSRTFPAAGPRTTKEISATAPLLPWTRKLAWRISEGGCASQSGGSAAVVAALDVAGAKAEGEEAFVGIAASGAGVLSSGALAMR